MLLSIENAQLKLTVDTLGAQMKELLGSDCVQYLWSGDPKYWKSVAPNLFPFIGRLTDNACRIYGNTYPLKIHGFASSQSFVPVEQTADRLTLCLESNEETKLQYPFDFAFYVTYTLDGNKLTISYRVENRSAVTMPFGIGGHPGFRVPLADGEDFTDYYLEFSQPCDPTRIGFTPSVLLSGHDEAYPLEEGKLLPLRHDLFDDDAIILKNMAREITLRCRKSARAITVCYPQMPYLGIWHRPKTDAPYVCIEPWSSLPSRQDVIEELTCKSDMIQLPAGQSYENVWSITIY